MGCRRLVALRTRSARWRRPTWNASRPFWAAGLCVIAGHAAPVAAAELPRSGEAMDYLSPVPVAEFHPRWTEAHRREALTVGDVLVWPSLTVGSAFDTNPFQSRRPGRSVVGAQVAPAVLVERESGVHRTTAYGEGDLRTFPQAGGADTQHGRAGVLHDWAIARDATVRLQGEIARRTDPFDNAQLIAAGMPERLIEETSILGAGSVQKTFDRSFVILSGSVLRSRFDGLRDERLAGRPALNAETVLTLRGRVGTLFGPGLFAFLEPSANDRAIDALPRASSGTRVVAGVGAIGFGLLSGEVFAGRQVQIYPDRGGSQATPVFGARAGWTPRAGWTVTLQADRALGDVAIATVADPLGAPLRQDSAVATLRCAVSPLWTAEGAFGVIRADYLESRRQDRLTLAQVRASYALSRSLDLTGSIRFTALHSSVALATYQRTAATLGATYRY